MVEHRKAVAGLIAAAVVVLVGGAAHAAIVSNYVIIATGDSTGDNNVDKALSMQDSEIGAISSATSGPLRFNAVSPPQGYRAYPSGTRYPTTGVITRDGDAAITSSSGRIDLQNSDVHTVNKGPNFAGSQGIDCRDTYNNCTDNGGKISTSNSFGAAHSGSGFNQTALPAGPSFSQIANNNGVQGSVSMTGLLTELTTQRDGYWALASNSVINTDKLENGDFIYTYGSGLHVVDITTNGSDFSVNNANFIVSGNADTFVIFRILNELGGECTTGNPCKNLLASNSNFLLQGDIGLSNLLFLVDSASGNGSFGFNNVNFYGYSFWDYAGDGLKNEAVWNNVRGCGQVITDKVNFNNVSMTNCAFDTGTPVPLPAAAWLLLSGLGGLGFIRRRKAA